MLSTFLCYIKQQVIQWGFGEDECYYIREEIVR